MGRAGWGTTPGTFHVALLVATAAGRVCCMHLPTAQALKRQAGNLQSRDNSQCLKFMHIPKNGGTSMESANLKLPPGQRAFDSMAVSIYDRDAAFMHRSPGDLYDWSHQDKPENFAGSQVDYYKMHWGLWAGFRLEYMGGIDFCQDFHTPPVASSHVAAWYVEAKANGCTVFCSVRDPLERLISGYKFFKKGPCSAAGFDAFVGPFLNELRERPFLDNCLWAAQHDYVFGNNGTRYCDTILHQEHLTDEFNAFMAENGKSLRLGDHRLFSTEGCHIDAGSLSAATKDLVYNFFKADYDAFGYARPS